MLLHGRNPGRRRLVEVRGLVRLPGWDICPAAGRAMRELAIRHLVTRWELVEQPASLSQEFGR